MVTKILLSFALLIAFSASVSAIDCHSGSPGGWSYCSSVCPCDVGGGDCDSDRECKSGLICGTDNGPKYKYSPTVDVCINSSSNNSCHKRPLGDWSYCSSSCPCGIGEGDCDWNSQCKTGLICVNDVGAKYGWSRYADVCQQPTRPPCNCSNWTSGPCRGSCKNGEREQTRLCSPNSCATQSRCVPDSKCNLTEKKPQIDWDWKYTNSTITRNSTTVCVKANTLVNCTLTLNWTSYANSTRGNVICWNLHNLDNGNYTLQAYCDDFSGNRTNTSKAWLNISPGCTDSDVGQNPTIKGTVHVSGNSYTDSCRTPNYLWEYYCNGDKLGTITQYCPGGCKDGKCIPIVCKDTDGGKDYYVAGITRNITGISYGDVCSFDLKYLTEYSCKNGAATKDKKLCTYGCLKGACKTGCYTEPPGDYDYCSASCLCGEGQGDCETGQCKPGLYCAQDVGAKYGWSRYTDVCEKIGSCHKDTLGGWSYCSSSCPCDAGEGDCDWNAQCKAGLTCVNDVGAKYGWSRYADVCEKTSSCHRGTLGGWSYCSSSCPCDAGEGDCDWNAQCKAGLTCVNDVGAKYGWSRYVDVCEKR